jgi:ankyrin repeat protein
MFDVTGSNSSFINDTRKSDQLATISYFNSTPDNSDNAACMLCYKVLPVNTGSPNRVIAEPCGHGFCVNCTDNLPNRDLEPLKKCLTRRTITNYIVASRDTVNKLGYENNFFISKAVLAIVDGRLDVLRHLLSCVPQEFDINCEHKNICKEFNSSGKLYINTPGGCASGNLLSIAEFHAQKETDATKQQERQQITVFLTKILIKRYTRKNSLTKLTKVLDKVLTQNNKELINYFLETIKKHSSFQNIEERIEILTTVSKHADLSVQEQFFDALKIDLNNKDIAKALLPMYSHQEHWSITNKLISTATGINCLDDLPVRSMIKNHNLQDIDLLINAGYNLDAKDKNGMTVMHYLSNLDTDNKINVDADMLKFFIDKGFDINKHYTISDSSKTEPFFIPLVTKSIVENDESLFNLILDTLAQPKYIEKRTPLLSMDFTRIAFRALKHRNYNFFYILTQHKSASYYLHFNALIKMDTEVFTLLSYIVKQGNAELVKYIFSYHDANPPVDKAHKMDINIRNKRANKTKEALFVASSYGYTEIMQLLIDRGANKNKESRFLDNDNDDDDYDNEAPIHIAAKNGFSDAVMLLLATPGVIIKLKTNDGKTAYDCFLTNFQLYDNEGNFDIETVKRDHSIKDLHCLLSLAIAMGDNLIASQLLKDKDILSYEGEYQYLPLNFIMARNNYKLIEDFVISLTENNINIDVEYIDFKGEKQLLFVELFKYAMKFNKLKIATLIIDKIKEENPSLLSSAVFENNSTILEFIAKNYNNTSETREVLNYTIASIPASVKESDSFNERLKQSQIGSSEAEKHLLSFCLETIALQKIKRKRAQKRKLANN